MREAPSPSPIVTLREVERRAILDALGRLGGNRTQAAQALGINVRTLQRKIERLGLAPPDSRVIRGAE